MVNNTDINIELTYDKNWYNDSKTYNTLLSLNSLLISCDNKKILLNIKQVQFISANLFALLGCILDTAIVVHHHKILFRSIHPKVKIVMQKNGFNKHFTWDHVEDSNHSTMEYRLFDATTEKLEEFEKYIVINVFNRKNMPSMSDKVRDRMIDNFLEMFNNVIDHADSNTVYVCGQYFPKTANLTLSIVDSGRTIKENVLNYFHGAMPEECKNSLEWAIISGNSTSSKVAPGGLGFSIILEFIQLNNGKFTLISDNECCEINDKGKRFFNLDDKFQGTVVTITFNLHDDFTYILEEDDIEMIVF